MIKKTGRDLKLKFMIMNHRVSSLEPQCQKVIFLKN